jgi:hypothetical protein
MGSLLIEDQKMGQLGDDLQSESIGSGNAAAAGAVR